MIGEIVGREKRFIAGFNELQSAVRLRVDTLHDLLLALQADVDEQLLVQPRVRHRRGTRRQEKKNRTSNVPAPAFPDPCSPSSANSRSPSEPHQVDEEASNPYLALLDLQCSDCGLWYVGYRHLRTETSCSQCLAFRYDDFDDDGNIIPPY